MKVTIEIDTASGEAGHRAAADVLAKLFGADPLVPAAAPAPAAPGPATPPAAPAPAAPPAATPTPAAPPPSTPAPAPATPPAAAPAPSAPPAAASGMSAATFNAQVQLYAKEHKPAGAKQRFAEVATAFNQPAWTTIGAIPADQYEAVAAWFVPASGTKAA